jgi:hypothetical protein
MPDDVCIDCKKHVQNPPKGRIILFCESCTEKWNEIANQLGSCESLEECVEKNLNGTWGYRLKEMEGQWIIDN